MAHFAQLNADNIVTSVVVVANSECLDENGSELEQKGIDFCVNLFGGRWIQTSYNGNIRKNFAGIGHYYDEARDAFISPRPFISWTFNEDTCRWEPPVPQPTNALHYWDEKDQTWKPVSL